MKTAQRLRPWRGKGHDPPTRSQGVRFQTNPGAVITVKASLGGLTDGSFLFFVQNGQVNGGYKGRLSNPLQLQGKTP